MDNFEYSIQINDRDWEEFYSTAEECGLIQASLAKEEELWLSDSEHDDTANCMPSNKHKFIRVSLCPPQPPHEYPALQISQPVVSQSVQTSNRWLSPNEDVLSGSEDEEEFGSVTRFLCQKEYMMQKTESEQRIDIPLPKSVCHDEVTNPPNDHPKLNSVGESLVEYMRTLNLGKNVPYKVDPQQLLGKTTMERSSNTQEELEHPDIRATVSVQPDGNPRPSVNLSYPNKIESCSSVNGYIQDENIPNVNTCEHEAIGQMGHSGHKDTLSESLSKDDCCSTEHGMFEGPASLEEPPSSKDNGLVYYTMKNDLLNNSCEVATEANVNSSAVEQNVPTSTIEELNPCIFQSDSLNVDMKTTSNVYNIDLTTSTHSLVPVNITTTSWRNQAPLSYPSSATDSKTALTLPEMYDFFFDDVSESVTPVNITTRSWRDQAPLSYSSSASNSKTALTLPEMYDFFFDEVSDTVSTVNITTTSWRDQAPLSYSSSASNSKTALTLPEMYDFFFDDVSDTVSLETESNMECKEGIVYTPNMYEYFFLEDEDENRAKNRGGNRSQESGTDLALASTSSAEATWPEACEFFFADGPQNQDREGIMFSVPSSQVQSAVDIIQSFIPKGLKGFTVRRAHHRRGPGGKLISQEHPGTPEESNTSTSGAIAPYLSPSRSDACLVFLAFASWAVKSSDLQSSDGWKTALLANIGAVSAIRYLRRRSRRTWQESPPQTGDET